MEEVTTQKLPEFGIRVRRELKTSPEGLVTQTLEEGRLVRIGWYNGNSSDFFDIEAPAGTVVNWRPESQPKLRKGKQVPDRRWVHIQTIRTPDPRIRVGDIAWERDESGKFTRPVMHPDFLARQAAEKPTLELEKL